MKTRYLGIGLALMLTGTGMAQLPFPQPDPEVRADQGNERAQLKKTGERYGALWQTGKGRWKQLEARFRKAAKCYFAVVDKMDFAADGSCEITFQAWFESALGSMRSETFSIGASGLRSDKAPPAMPIFPKGRVLTLSWKRTDCPPPFATGSAVYLGVDADGAVICANHPVYDISAVRVGDGGKVETILQLEKLEEGVPPKSNYPLSIATKKLIYVKPDFTNLELAGSAARTTDLLWDAEGGIALVALGEEAADDATESMIGLSERKGLPVENDPKFRFLLGSDGWKRYKDLPRNAGTIGFEYLIPASQFITIQDGYDDVGLEEMLTEKGTPAASVWVFSDSSTRLLTKADLAGLDPDQLWKAKNEIYARRGYIFATAKGRAYAASLGDAYAGRIESQDAVSGSFNEFERKNVALIATFMK